MAYKAVYKMDTLVTDYSGNGETLTNTNGVTQVDGRSGKAAAFGNVSGRKLNRNTNLGLTGSTSYTVKMWGRVKSETSTDSDFYFKPTHGTDNARYCRGLYEHNGGSRRMRWGANGLTPYWIDVNGNIGDDVWRHFVFSFESGVGVNLYINGVLAGTNSTSAPYTDTGTEQVEFGGTSAMGTPTSNTEVDEVIVDNTVWTAQRVKTQYAFERGCLIS